MGAANPGNVLEKIETIVATGKQVRRISGRAVRARKVNRRIARLIRGRRNSLKSVRRREIKTLVLTLLSAAHPKKSKTEFTDDSWTEDVSFANGNVMRAGRKAIAETGHESLVQLTAAERLECVEIRVIQARKQTVALTEAMIDSNSAVIVIIPESRSGDVVLHFSRQVRERHLLEERKRAPI